MTENDAARNLLMAVEDPLTGEEDVAPTMNLRWLGKRGTTTEPRRLQQMFWVRKLRRHSIVAGEAEWRDVPIHLED